MEKIISNMQDLINRFENASDPRVKDWPLVHNIWSPILAVLCYVSIVIIGPRAMKNRPAFQLKLVMCLYNLVAVLLSGYMFVKLLVCITRANYNLLCQPINYSFDNPLEMELCAGSWLKTLQTTTKMARLLWLHYISKYFEMVDTFIFILRKKENQISFLHVYHHSSVVILWWIAAKWIAGGTSFVPAIINSFVHVVMYTYYGLSMFPSLRKYLWWKRYLTQFQMTQFCMFFVHSFYVIASDCKLVYPPYMAVVALLYMVTLLFLFGKFYLASYSSPKTKPKALKTDERNGFYSRDENRNKKLS